MVTQLTLHFSLEELSSNGSHPDIQNTPGTGITINLHKMAAKLEELRGILAAYYGREIRVGVKYGYRGPALNAAVGGSPTSAHQEGLAADTFYQDPVTPDAVFQILRTHATFMQDVDQLIIERGCLHVGLPCRASGYAARREMRGEAWIGGERHYPLIGVWKMRSNGAAGGA